MSNKEKRSLGERANLLLAAIKNWPIIRRITLSLLVVTLCGLVIIYTLVLCCAYTSTNMISGTATVITSFKTDQTEFKNTIDEDDNNAGQIREILKPESEPLPGVSIVQEHQCTSWENFIYPPNVYTFFSQDITGKDGKFSFHKSPCLKKIIYSKEGYQLVEKGDTNNPHKSVQNVIFQKKINKISLDTDPKILYTDSAFEYKIKFFNADNKQLFLANPNKTFKFTDPLGTKFDFKKAELVNEISHIARANSFSGKAKVEIVITDAEGVTVACAPFFLDISMPIDIDNIAKKNIASKSARSFRTTETALFLDRPNYWVTIFDKIDTNSSHRLSFTFTLPNTETVLAVKFMGVEFHIGEHNQESIETKPTLFNDSLIPSAIIPKPTLQHKLTENIPISLAITFTKPDKFFFEFVIPQPGDLKPFYEPVSVQVSQANLLIPTRIPFPAKVSFVCKEESSAARKKHPSKGVIFNDFKIY